MISKEKVKGILTSFALSYTNSDNPDCVAQMVKDVNAHCVALGIYHETFADLDWAKENTPGHDISKSDVLKLARLIWVEHCTALVTAGATADEFTPLDAISRAETFVKAEAVYMA